MLKNIFELVEPHLSLDEFQPEKVKFVYGEWMLDSRYITNELTRLLKVNKIQFKSIKHKTKTDRYKRDVTVYDSVNVIRKIKNLSIKVVSVSDDNLTDNYYSVQQVRL